MVVPIIACPASNPEFLVKTCFYQWLKEPEEVREESQRGDRASEGGKGGAGEGGAGGGSGFPLWETTVTVSLHMAPGTWGCVWHPDTWTPADGFCEPHLLSPYPPSSPPPEAALWAAWVQLLSPAAGSPLSILSPADPPQ